MKNLKRIPKFRTEDEESRFWAAHDFTDYYDSEKRVDPNFINLKPTTQPISIRLPKHMLHTLKVLANEQDVPYQSLLKMYLDEKLKEKLAQKRSVASA